MSLILHRGNCYAWIGFNFSFLLCFHNLFFLYARPDILKFMNPALFYSQHTVYFVVLCIDARKCRVKSTWRYKLKSSTIQAHRVQYSDADMYKHYTLLKEGRVRECKRSSVPHERHIVLVWVLFLDDLVQRQRIRLMVALSCISGLTREMC